MFLSTDLRRLMGNAVTVVINVDDQSINFFPEKGFRGEIESRCTNHILSNQIQITQSSS